MPYGAIGVSRAASLAVDQCIDVLTSEIGETNHRVWLSEQRYLHAAGGEWSEEWISEMGNPGDGGFIVQRRWQTDSECHSCGESN